MKSLHLSLLRFVLSALALGPLCPAAAADDAPAPAAVALAPDAFPAGEELRYRARVWKGLGFLGADVGDAVLRVERDEAAPGGPPAWRFSARASGGGFGYSLRTEITSAVAASGAPLRYGYDQKGSETKAVRLEYDAAGRIVWWKQQHCPGCDAVAHASASPSEHAGVPASGRSGRGGGAAGRPEAASDGRRKPREHRNGNVHCSEGKRCSNEKHRLWVRRYEHGEGAGAPAYDMLAAVYLARTLDLAPGASRTLRTVNDDAIFDVTIRCTGEEKVKTAAGRFRTLRLALEPKLVSGSPSVLKKGDKFRGLFGLTGTIRVWIDKATRAPVKIAGTIPFGVDLNGEVELVKVRR